MPQATVKVDEVKALQTQSGKTRFVLVDDSGRECTTFRELVAEDIADEDDERNKREARFPGPRVVSLSTRRQTRSDP